MKNSNRHNEILYYIKFKMNKKTSTGHKFLWHLDSKYIYLPLMEAKLIHKILYHKIIFYNLHNIYIVIII